MSPLSGWKGLIVGGHFGLKREKEKPKSEKAKEGERMIVGEERGGKMAALQSQRKW